MKAKLILFLLIISSYNLFSQSNDDIYFDGVEENRVEKTVSSEQYDSEETNIYVETDLDYTSRIRRFHQPVRGFGYYNNYYCNQYWYNPYSYNFYPHHYGFNNYYGWNNLYNPYTYNPYRYYGWNNWYNPYVYNGWNNNSWNNWNVGNNNSWNWFDRPSTTNVVTNRNTRSSDTGLNRSRNVPVSGYDVQQRQTYTPQIRVERNQNIRTESNFGRVPSAPSRINNNTINTRRYNSNSGRR